MAKTNMKCMYKAKYAEWLVSGWKHKLHAMNWAEKVPFQDRWSLNGVVLKTGTTMYLQSTISVKNCARQCMPHI